MPRMRELRFDGVYAAALPAEKDAAGKPRWILVSSTRMAPRSKLSFMVRLLIARVGLDEDERLLRSLEAGGDSSPCPSTGMMESERTGKVADEAWTTNPTVKVSSPMAGSSSPSIALEARWLPSVSPSPVRGGPRAKTEIAGPSLLESGIQSTLRPRPGRKHQRASPRNSRFRPQTPIRILTFNWKASNGIVSGEGPKAVWEENWSTEASSGTISVEISDGRGGRITYTGTHRLPRKADGPSTDEDEVERRRPLRYSSQVARLAVIGFATEELDGDADGAIPPD